MTVLFAGIAFLIGVVFSALFSGAETGFYRVSRLRLEVAAGSGDLVARILAWFAERPAVFISTTLVGNNLANYLVSLGAVVIVEELARPSPSAVELVTALVVTPVVFISGELIPKRLFLQAPFTLLRLTGPVFTLAAVLLLPLTAVLWAYVRLLALLIPKTAGFAQSQIANQELRRILEEGEHAGLIVGVQLLIARNVLKNGAVPIETWAVPMEDFPALLADSTWRQWRQSHQGESALREYALVFQERQPHHLLGYVFTPLLVLNPDTPVREFVQPILRVRRGERLVSVLRLLFQRGEPIALVLDSHNRPYGIIEEKALRRAYLTD